MFKRLNLFLSCCVYLFSLMLTHAESIQPNKKKAFPLRTIYFKASLSNGKEYEIKVNINSQEIANRLFQIYGSQTYTLMRDEKTFEEAVQRAYQEIKSNKISSELISTYLKEPEFSSIKTQWEISCFLQRQEHLSRLLQESTVVSEEEEAAAERALEVVPERRLQGSYIMVNSAEIANSIYNTTIFSNSITDLEKQREAFNKVASKFGKVKTISFREKNYMTFEEILANFGLEFADLVKINSGASAPISRNQSEFFIFFIDKNESIKASKGKIRRYAVSKKISQLTDSLKKSLEIKYPNDLQVDQIICNIDGIEIRVAHLLKFLELKIPGKSIKRLVGSMPQNKADAFIETAVSSLIDLILQAKIAEKEGIQSEDFSILEIELENFLSKIARAIISQEDINNKYEEEFKNNPSFKQRIKWNQISVESKNIAYTIFSNLQNKDANKDVNLKEAFKEQKSIYTVSHSKVGDANKNEFLKIFPFIIDSPLSEQKIDFDSLSEGKIYISSLGDKYYIILIESIYGVETNLDQLRSEIVSRIEKEKVSSILNSINNIQTEKPGAIKNQ